MPSWPRAAPGLPVLSRPSGPGRAAGCRAAAWTQPPPPPPRAPRARADATTSIVTSAFARLHVPTIWPSTRTAPGQTRGVQSSRRWSESGTRSSRSAPCRRKYASPLGRSRADAAGPPGARNAGSSRLRIHAIADGRPHRRQRLGERVERGAAGRRRPDPGPLGECRGRCRTEDVQVSARELEARVAGVDVRRRHGPDGGPTCPVPPDQHRAGRRGVPQPVRVLAEPAPRLAVGHRSAVEEGMQPAGEIVCIASPLRVVGEPPEREDREVTRSDDVGAEPRPPQLHERRVLPRVRSGPVDSGMDRQDGRPRHAVLQARPGRAPERRRARWQPLVEGTDGPSVA